MKVKSLLALGCVSSFVAACGLAPSQVGMAIISDTKEPILVTDKAGTKVGKACGRNILGFYSEGDMSIEAAKKNGKITEVSSVDKTVTNRVLISDVCTIVTGR